MNMNTQIKKVLISAALILAILVSVLLVAPKMSKPETYNHLISELNEKQTTVMEMTAASAAASLALGAIPGDATTPIATKVVDMAGYFIIILSVIILEKYMLTIAGYLAFTWLVPIACFLFAINLFLDKRMIRHLAFRLLIFSTAIVLIVPLSVKITDVVEKTNKVSINTTLEDLKGIEKEAEGVTQAMEEEEIPSADSQETQNTGPIQIIEDIKEKVNDMIDDTKEKIQDTAEGITKLTEETIEKAKTTLNKFVEVVVIMLVTTCGIPILTLILLAWITKTLLGLEIDWGRQKERARFLRRIESGKTEE